MNRRSGKATGRHAVKAVFRALNRAYGPLPPFRTESPLDVLIATVLSQNTSDVNSGRAYRCLRRRFPTWTEVSAAAHCDIAAAIHCGGLARVKAHRIRRILRLIRKRERRLSLARLAGLSSTDALAWLTDLPGIGLKTACCVLLFGFGRPVMPVDTHVYRIAGRLGWIRHRTPIDQVSAILERMIPARWILPMHLYLIDHGRRLCRPNRPACGICPIAGYCASASF